MQIWDVAEHKLLLSVPVTNDDHLRRLLVARWQTRRLRLHRQIGPRHRRRESASKSCSNRPTTTGFSAPRSPIDGSHLVSVGRDMSAKLIEVATQRFVDNITSITPGALKGGIQSVQTHPLRDEIIFGGADGMPRIYRMQRTTAAPNRRRCQPVVGIAAAAGPRVQRRYHAATAASSPPAAASTATATSTSIGWSRPPKSPTAFKRFSTSRCSLARAEETAQLHKHFEQGVQTLAKFEVAEGGVYAVALSPKGDRVAAAGGDGTVRLIDTQNGSLVDFVRAGRNQQGVKRRPFAETKANIRSSRLRQR